METIEQKASQNMEGIVTLHRWEKLNSFCNILLKSLVVLQVVSASKKNKLFMMAFNLKIKSFVFKVLEIGMELIFGMQCKM